jgi:hypothetical protein
LLLRALLAPARALAGCLRRSAPQHADPAAIPMIEMGFRRALHVRDKAC